MLADTLAVVFRDIDHSDALEERIREEAVKLDRIFDRIIKGTVTIEAPHRHHQHGRRYSVHIRLSLPGTDELVISREPGKAEGHEDPYLAVRDAFAAARRRLNDHVARLRDKAKCGISAGELAADSGGV